MRGEGKTRFLLLTRPECHLCEEFKDELLAGFPGLEFDEACVDDRPEWREQYGTRIPVLLDADGTVVGEAGENYEKIKTRIAQRAPRPQRNAKERN